MRYRPPCVITRRCVAAHRMVTGCYHSAEFLDWIAHALM